MKKQNEKIIYARGLLKAANLDNAVLYEIINSMLEAMEKEESAVQKLSDQLQEMDEYVESIDDALTDVEDMLQSFRDDFDGKDDGDFDNDDDFDDDKDDEPSLRLVKKNHECKCGHGHEDGHVCHCHGGEEDCDCEDDEEDEADEVDLDAFDNLFLGAMCPECQRLFCVTDANFDDPEALFRCPYCGKDVHITPIDQSSVPIAERVDR